jgi:hypothetical protein
MEALLLVTDRGGATMLARIGITRALNRAGRTRTMAHGASGQGLLIR